MGMLNILLLDDEENTRKSLSTFLTMHGFAVETAAHPSEALEKLEEGRFQVLLTDVRMTEMDGIQLTEKVRESFPGITVLIMTAYGNVKDAVTAMKKGAFDYLTKPLDQDELLLSLRKIGDYYTLVSEVRDLRRRLGAESQYEGIVGCSDVMRQMYSLIDMAARSDSGVLITGETGSGKEVVARTIHRNSARKDGPLIAVSCGALPETLLESELFGHLKGAFTGAVSDRIGKIRSAHGGTLFLDEIGTLSHSAQAKLLRVLEEQRFEPLGGDRAIEVDIRIIAATNEDLERAISAGRFRKDLYYRLNVLHIDVPPLRDHREDIPLLARHILIKLGKADVKVSSGAMNLFMRYNWPGNVRELENVIERALASMEGDIILAEHLPNSLGARGLEAASKLEDKVSLYEKHLIEEKLRETKGNVARAARELRAPLRSFRRKIARYSIQPKKFKKQIS